MKNTITNTETAKKSLYRPFKVKFSNYDSAKTFLNHIKKVYANAICSGDVVSLDPPASPIARRNLSIIAYQDFGAERVDY